MSLNSLTCVGVHLSASPKPFTFAALDEEQRILAFGEGEMVDALSYLAGLGRAVVAVSAPARTNSGFLDTPEARERLNLPPGRWVTLRSAEYELDQAGMAVPHTPVRAESVPLWMRAGFRFYEQLNALGYQPYPAPEAPRQWLETQADAAYWSLLGVVTFPYGSLESRLQRQLALAGCGLPVPDAMDFFEEVTRYKLLRGQLPLEGIYSPAELNALVCAHTAWLAASRPDALRCLGQPEDGLVYLPAPDPR